MAEKIKPKKKKSKLRENLELILWAVLIALLLRIFIIEAYKIPTQSLYPNYLQNDHLLVFKPIYGVKLPFVKAKLPAFAKPKRGNIVVFQNPRYKSPGFFLEFLDLITFSIFALDQDPVKNPKNFIKRCLAGPGDTVEWVENRKIKINDEELEHTDYEFFDYGSVKWGESARIKEVDQFIEHNKNKTYEVQYIYSESNKDISIIELPKLYYMPKKGDILTIKRTSPTSDSFTYKIGDVDISHLWETESRNTPYGGGDIKIRGYVEIFEEETNKDLSKKELLKLTKEGEFTHKIRHDYYFMFGDNRDDSEDGRFFGPVRDKLIIGAPVFRYFPFTRFGCVG